MYERLNAHLQELVDPQARAILADALGCAIVGGPDTVHDALEDFMPYRAGELMMANARFEIVAEVHSGMNATALC